MSLFAVIMNFTVGNIIWIRIFILKNFLFLYYSVVEFALVNLSLWNAINLDGHSPLPISKLSLKKCLLEYHFLYKDRAPERAVHCRAILKVHCLLIGHLPPKQSELIFLSFDMFTKLFTNRQNTVVIFY